MILTEESVLLVIRVSRPKFKNKHDKLAFVIHASFLASGFVLTAIGPPAFSLQSLSSSSNEEVGINNWNEADEEYAFVYRNPNNGEKKVLLKCLAMGDKLMVDAMTDGSSEPVNLEINVDDYVNETVSSDYNEQYRNLGKLVRNLESNLISKLDGSSSGGHATESSRPSTVEEPNVIRDESTDSRDPQPAGYVVPPVIPVGGDDLYPSPGAGVFPTRGDFGGGGSMLLGPQDPRWFSDGRGYPGVNPLGGLVPPGARYDPYGPPGVPGFEPDAFGRFPRGPNPGRGTRPPGRIHPDLEQPGSGGFDDFI